MFYDSMENCIRCIEGECMKPTNRRITFKWQFIFILNKIPEELEKNMERCLVEMRNGIYRFYEA